jgi:hypothetical protein
MPFAFILDTAWRFIERAEPSQNSIKVCQPETVTLFVSLG